jgi:hypothetical protein
MQAWDRGNAGIHSNRSEKGKYGHIARIEIASIILPFLIAVANCNRRARQTYL